MLKAIKITFVLILLSVIIEAQANAWEEFLNNSQYDAVSKEVISGDAKLGEIFYFRQIHKTNSLWALESSYNTILQCQYEIFLALKALNPNMICTEGNDWIFSSDALRQDKKSMAVLSRYLPIGWYKVSDVKQLTEQQKNMLYKLGAGRVYVLTCAVEKKSALLQGVDQLKITMAGEAVLNSPKAKKFMQETKSTIEPVPEAKMPAPLVHWEKIHADVVKAFLKANKGAKIAIIFGSAHRFDRHFRKQKVRLNRVTFKKLLK